MRLLLLAGLACSQLALSGCAAVMSAAATHSVAIASAIDLAPVVLAMGAVGAVGIAGVAGEQRETHEPGTFGAYLTESQAAARSLVQDGMRGQREVAVAAGLQAQRAVARAYVAYRDSLNLKLDALAGPEKNFREEIDAVIAGLGAESNHSNQSIKRAGDRAQTMADALRVPGTAPQVRSYGPLYLFPFLPFQSINVRGSFPADYPGGAVPRLSFKGKSYKAFSYDTQSLEFSIPTADLDAAEPQAIVWIRGELDVPWKGPIFDSVSRAGFENFVVIGVLPHSFGRATMEHRTTTLRREEKSRATEEFPVVAEHAGVEESRCLNLTPQERSEGWKVKTGSGRVVSKAAGGAEPQADWRELGMQSENEQSICWRIQVLPSVTGKNTWSIAATLWREVRETGVSSEQFELSWGKSRVFAYPAGSWKLRYWKFGGSPVELEAPEAANPLVQVSSDARSVTIRTYPH